MEMVQRITDWVSVDQTKGTGWSDSEWVPSCVVYDTLHETFIVVRTKRITPRKFKQHKHE